MFRGFNLKLAADNFEDEAYKFGSKLYNEQRKAVSNILDVFLTHDGKINAEKMQENWFPQINADIFISHSHKDERIAVSLAGVLKSSFGLVSFIDSCAWGYADRLLRIIDDEFCRNKNSKTYNYEKRNRSTSHVHMVLSTALSKMIDNCECLFFLNTPSSISPSKAVENTHGTTGSPWIYSEIAISRLLRRKRPRRDTIRKSLTNARREELDILYSVELDHLTDLDEDDLIAWGNSDGDDWHALDRLYKLNQE